MENVEVSGRRFLIVGMQRSGTTVLQRYLAQAGSVFVHPKEISSHFFAYLDGHFYASPHLSSQTERLVDDLVRIVARAGANGSELGDDLALGFKTAIGDEVIAEKVVGNIRNYFASWKVVVVLRNDVIACCASFFRASHSGVWHKSPGSSVASTRIRIGRRYFIRYVYSWMHINKWLSSLAGEGRFLFLDYERDILSGRVFDTEVLFDHLGLRRTEGMQVPLEKISPEPASYVEDYEDLLAIQPAVINAFENGESLMDVMKKFSPPFKSLLSAWGYAARKDPLNFLRPDVIRRVVREQSL